MRIALSLVAAITVLSMPIESRAQTSFSGSISTDTTWTAGGNPYILTGDVIIEENATLTIEAGVNVLVEDTDDADAAGDNRVQFFVMGGLIVNGTSAARVTFAPRQPGAPAGTWRGFEISEGTGTVSISYASIGGAVWALDTRRPGATVTVNHVHFYNMSEIGLWLVGGEPQILASLITPGLGADAAIRTIFSAQPLLVNNVIAGFQYGIDLNQNVATNNYISNNTIVGAQTGIRVAPESGSSINAFITNNIINGMALPGVTGIEVLAAAGVNVTLSHNNVTGTTPYSGIAPGPNSLSVNPGFVSSTDYHLTATSPMINAGTGPVNAPLVDFDNVTRPIGAGFDIGAYEFVPVVTPPTADAGPPQTFNATATGTAAVTITGVGTAPAGSVLTYQWLEDVTELGTNATLSRPFTAGVHLLTFKVTDQYGQSGSDTVLIGVLGTTGPAGATGPQGNSVAMVADTTGCLTGGVKLTIVDHNGAAVGAPQFVCNGATGPTGATGAQGPPGPSGSAGPGSVLFVVKGTTAPVGYQFVGSTKQVVPGRGQIEMDIYVKQ